MVAVVAVVVGVIRSSRSGRILRCLLGLQLHGWLKNQRSWNLHSCCLGSNPAYTICFNGIPGRLLKSSFPHLSGSGSGSGSW